MPEEFEEKPGESVNLEQYLAIVRRRRWYFLVPLFVGWLVVWGVSWLRAIGLSVWHSHPGRTADRAVTICSSKHCHDNLQDRLQSITQQILSRTRLMRIIESQNLYAESRQRSTPG